MQRRAAVRPLPQEGQDLRLRPPSEERPPQPPRLRRPAEQGPRQAQGSPREPLSGAGGGLAPTGDAARGRGSTGPLDRPQRPRRPLRRQRRKQRQHLRVGAAIAGLPPPAPAPTPAATPRRPGAPAAFDAAPRCLRTHRGPSPHGIVAAGGSPAPGAVAARPCPADQKRVGGGGGCGWRAGR